MPASPLFFRRPVPAPYFQSLFLILQIQPPSGGIIKIYSPRFKKTRRWRGGGGVRTMFIISKTKELSFRCSAEYQNFWIWLRKSGPIYPLAFKFKSFILRRLSLILPFSTHSMFKLERCLLWFRLVSAVLPSQLRNVGSLVCSSM